MTTAVDIVPGDAQWTRRLTASRFGALMRGRGSWPSLRRDMLAPPKPFTSWQTEHGKENEPRARALYEIETGRTCAVPKFRTLAEDDRIGASIDWLTNDARLGEAKCPVVVGRHLLARQGVFDAEYFWQVMGGLMVWPELEVADFVSFSPDVPVEESIAIVEVPRDERAIAKLRDTCLRFWDWMETATDDATHDFLIPGVKGAKLF